MQACYVQCACSMAGVYMKDPKIPFSSLEQREIWQKAIINTIMIIYLFIFVYLSIYLFIY